MVISFTSKKIISSDVSIDTSGFSGSLDPSDTDVQKALSTLDQHVQKVTYGGTGITAYTRGDILYASDGYTLSKLEAGDENEILMMNSGVPVWALNQVDIVDGGTF